MVKISPESVTGPEQGTSSGRIATFNRWSGTKKFINLLGKQEDTNQLLITL